MLQLGFLNKEEKIHINQIETLCSFVEMKELKKSWEAARLFCQLSKRPRQQQFCVWVLLD